MIAAEIPTRRSRIRAQTIAEIKEAALVQLELDGPGGLSLRAVARSLGMSIAGLYRYFETRDALLMQLIEDGFDDLGAALDSVTGDDPATLLADRLRAYRRWAVAKPRLVNLLFTDPIPGFVAPEDGPTTMAARRALRPLLVPASSMVGCSPDAVTAAATAAMVELWASVHGFVMLEVFHHLTWSGIDLDAAFDVVIERAVRELATDGPRP